MFSIVRPTISIIAGLLIIFFFVRPMYAQIGQLQEEADQYEETVQKVQEFNALLDSFLAKRNAILVRDLERLETFVPHGEIDEVGALVDLEALASAHGLIFRNVKVGVIGESDNTDELDDASGQIEPEVVSQGFDASEFLTQDIDFSVIGTYNQFRSFLEDLEESLVLMDLTKISFTVSEGELTQYDMTVRLFAIPNTNE